MCAKSWDRCPKLVAQICQAAGTPAAAWRLRLRAVAGGESGGAELAGVHLACGRIAGVARSIAEAHRFGVPEGPHLRPWEAEYHAEAVHVYGESLPATYQRDIASLFCHSVDTMAAQTIPAGLAEDWVIVSGYLRASSAAIMDWLALSPAESASRGAVEQMEIDDHTPTVVRFDRLAKLTSREGASRLERAAVAVQHHVGAPSSLVLDESQQRLLKGVTEGVTIVDLAESLGYSRSSIYRELKKLWRTLGVADRTQAMHKVAAEGLLD